MKTPKEWQDIWWSEQHDRRDFIRQIQDDARADLLNALARVEPVLTDVLKTYSAEGFNMFNVEFELDHIKTIRAAAMPNDES
jgi:hypothetical protein